MGFDGHYLNNHALICKNIRIFIW